MTTKAKPACPIEPNCPYFSQRNGSGQWGMIKVLGAVGALLVALLTILNLLGDLPLATRSELNEAIASVNSQVGLQLKIMNKQLCRIENRLEQDKGRGATQICQ